MPEFNRDPRDRRSLDEFAGDVPTFVGDFDFDFDDSDDEE